MMTAQERIPFTAPLTDRERSILTDRVLREKGIHLKRGQNGVVDWEKEIQDAIEAFEAMTPKQLAILNGTGAS